MRKIILILFFFFFSYCEINELGLIPAFYVVSTKNAESLIALAEEHQFHPISYNNYVSGLIDVPKNYHPFILFEGKNHSPLQVVAPDRNFNLPTYHKDYDPVEAIKVANLSDIDFNGWLAINEKKSFFTSDGKTHTVEIPPSLDNQLFTYAPADNMYKSTPSSLPFLVNKERYYSKSERLKYKNYSLRAYHVTYGAINTLEKINSHIEIIKNNNLDAIVIDYKPYFYEIQKNYKSYKSFMDASDDELINQMSTFQNMVNLFKKQNIKVSLRIVISTDQFLHRNNPNLMLWDRQTNKPWVDSFGQSWLDFYSIEGLNYYKKLIRVATKLSPSEIQFDYIRFPSDGDVSKIQARHSTNKPRYKAIDNFCKEILPIIDSANISFAVDIFGIVVWDKKDSTEVLGQNILTFMRYADEICPMLYPSHFSPGFENIKKPGDMPYLFMLKGTKRFKNLIDKYPQYTVKMVPWIQAFNYMSPSYSPTYIKEQLQAIKETGMDGFLAWNARNDYIVFIKGLK